MRPLPTNHIWSRVFYILTGEDAPRKSAAYLPNGARPIAGDRDFARGGRAMRVASAERIRRAAPIRIETISIVLFSRCGMTGVLGESDSRPPLLQTSDWALSISLCETR